MNLHYAPRTYSTMTDAKQAKLEVLYRELEQERNEIRNHREMSELYPQDAFYHDNQIKECNRIIAEIKTDIQRVLGQEDEQSDDDFQAHVDSMEAAIENAWTQVEIYHFRNGSQLHYLYVIDGYVKVCYWVSKRDGRSHEYHPSFLNHQSWGLHLREKFGYRKLSTVLWFNTMTGEYSTLSPEEMKR